MVRLDAIREKSYVCFVDLKCFLTFTSSLHYDRHRCLTIFILYVHAISTFTHRAIMNPLPEWSLRTDWLLVHHLPNPITIPLTLTSSLESASGRATPGSPRS
jgi:hypothetical protein